MKDSKTVFTNEAEAMAAFEQVDHPEWENALAYLMEHGSPEIKEAFRQAGRDALKSVFGVEFSHRHVTRDGERVIPISEIVEKLDVPISDLFQFMEQEGIKPLTDDDTYPVN